MSAIVLVGHRLLFAGMPKVLVVVIKNGRMYVNVFHSCKLTVKMTHNVMDTSTTVTAKQNNTSRELVSK